MKSQDLPNELTQRATVFHVMGKIAPVFEDYAVTEEDYLEFIYSLQAPERRPARLFEELGSRRLLVLGSGLCDWLVRFFLRGKCTERLSRRSTGDFLVGAQDSPELEEFLSHFAPSTRVIASDPAGFVSELHRRWCERRGHCTSQTSEHARPAAGPAAGSVFISYASEDRAAAKQLHDALEGMGIDAWFDQDDLPPGAQFNEVIQRAIEKSALFVPIISRHVLTQTRRNFRQEWSWALSELQKVRPDLEYVIPLAIDDTPISSAGIVKQFSACSWLEARDVRITSDKLARIKTAYRAFQKSDRSL